MPHLSGEKELRILSLNHASPERGKGTRSGEPLGGLGCIVWVKELLWLLCVEAQAAGTWYPWNPVFMCVCVYVYPWNPVFMCVCVCVYVYPWNPVFMYACVYVCVCVYVYASYYTCLYVYMSKNCSCVCMQECSCMHTYKDSRVTHTFGLRLVMKQNVFYTKLWTQISAQTIFVINIPSDSD